MTRLEIETQFERDIEQIGNEEMSGLLGLSQDPCFAVEAGEEFVTAVAVVGLHRVLA